MIEIGVQIHSVSDRNCKVVKSIKPKVFFHKELMVLGFFFTFRIGDTAYTGDLQFALSKTNDGIGDTKPNI